MSCVDSAQYVSACANLKLSGNRAQPTQYWTGPVLPSTSHGGPSSPRQQRISAAKEASVLFSPLVKAIYGNTEPVRVSWAIEREAVVSGEAEPIDGGSEDSEMSMMYARYLSWQ